MSPIIYYINNPIFREKMAAFDYDWTLVNPKNGKTFPRNKDDWQYLYFNIPEILKEYYDNNYMIVIFTNQSKLWKCDQISIVSKDLNIPVFIVIAMNKNEYKPNIKIFNDFLKDNIINKKESFYVGDALGRKNDFSDSDKLFAENIGIEYYAPEQIFNNLNVDKINDIDKNNITNLINLINSNNTEKNIIIMVGYPGSGKTTIAKQICNNLPNHILIESDIFKTSKKMIKFSLDHLSQNKSIIFDATNNTVNKRQEYILLANTYNYKIKCIHVNTSFELSYKRNILREESKQIPKIVYSVYKKKFEEPNEKEGFILYII